MPPSPLLASWPSKPPIPWLCIALATPPSTIEINIGSMPRSVSADRPVKRAACCTTVSIIPELPKIEDAMSSLFCCVCGAWAASALA